MLCSLCLLFVLAAIECSPTGTLVSSQDKVPAVALAPGSQKTKDAYVILQYGGFMLGARVLGRSLQNTGTEKDLIALCTETVTDETKAILKADGWIVKPINNIPNPYEDMSTKGAYFYGAYSKLTMWNMTEYKRLVYIDSDALVMSNIDHLFDCGPFCVAYRHSDLFNTGVMVIEPSASVFNDMVKKLSVLPSYTHGDQGFLNVYFNNLKYASMFNWSNSTRQQQPMRLPAGLNGDIGMYYLDGNKWVIPSEELRIIHYTMGPIKPWIWWTNYLFDLNQLWIDVRMALPDHDNTNTTYSPIFWAPYPLVILFFAAMICFRSYCGQCFNDTNFSAYLNTRFTHFLPLSILLLSYYLAFQIVPTTMLPNQAEYAFGLWCNFFLLLFLGGYCFLCHIASKQNSTSRKMRLSLLLYTIFFSTCVLLKVVPSIMTQSFSRLLVFLLFLSIHIVVSHKCGVYLIQAWIGSLIRPSPVHQRYQSHKHTQDS